MARPCHAPASVSSASAARASRSRSRLAPTGCVAVARAVVGSERGMATYTIRRAPGEARTFRIDYERELNPAQLEAASTLDGPVLVVAGAGSGKTRTLTYRVARLVESGVPARSIVLLTFTRRAAQEMLRRAGTLLGGGAEEVVGGTFHSFANAVLRRYARLRLAGGVHDPRSLRLRGRDPARARAPRPRSPRAAISAQADARDDLLDGGQQEPLDRRRARARARPPARGPGGHPPLSRGLR